MTCPQCGSECERDEVDNGVGMEAVGPWGCPNCHWVEDRPKWLVDSDDNPQSICEDCGLLVKHCDCDGIDDEDSCRNCAMPLSFCRCPEDDFRS